MLSLRSREIKIVEVDVSGPKERGSGKKKGNINRGINFHQGDCNHRRKGDCMKLSIKKDSSFVKKRGWESGRLRGKGRA